MKLNNPKKLIYYIIITFIIGVAPSIPIFKNMSMYQEINKPSLSPPSIVFPIAWTILYLLMAISIYKVNKTSDKNIPQANLIYYLQLIVNALWTPIFFGLKAYLFSYIWIIILIILVVTLIITFYKIDKTAAYLQIPYLLWLIFASYLNYGILILN